MRIFLDTGLSSYRLILATQDINFKSSSGRPHYNSEFFKLDEVESLFLIASRRLLFTWYFILSKKNRRLLQP